MPIHKITQEITNSNLDEVIQDIIKTADRSLNFFWLGTQPYRPLWELQKKLHQLRVDKKIPDIVLLLEHQPVYTFGKNADTNHLLDSYPRDADVVQIDRGGDITYHGPGQLVGYPILDLHDYKMSVSWYMRSLEDSIILMLDKAGIQSSRKHGLTGVWIEDEKICAMGVRLSRWVTMHGFALNVETEMRYFEGMIPCGIFEYGVTSIHDQLKKEISVPDVIEAFVSAFQHVFLNQTVSEPQTGIKR